MEGGRCDFAWTRRLSAASTNSKTRPLAEACPPLASPELPSSPPGSAVRRISPASTKARTAPSARAALPMSAWAGERTCGGARG